MGARSPLPKRLRAARLRAGISQREAGVRAGIDELSAGPRINQYEKGKHTPDYLTLSRLGEVLGVPAPYFYAEDDELARVIAGFARLPRAKRARILELLVEE